MDDVSGKSPLYIAALPPTTVRQLGSHQLVTDPSSVVKELIDNALDARATSIFVDIAANTVDSVQVKDDGHGIPSKDRELACRRYCTSKIRDFHDLKGVGGKWLGFRGEALASIADISGAVSITTRVEGEPVAVRLTYNRNGELTAIERGSHPVGTTVKVTKLLESAKVRNDLAIKGSAKCLAKIRRLVQGYALARPAVRFRLHVLKAKTNHGDFIYVPKADASVEDAVLKTIGIECALQCEWTALEFEGFDLHTFFPKPSAVGFKVASQGAFISIDSRPVSASRGTVRKIAVAVRERLRKANPTLRDVKDPFFTMNIICPEDSYDPNIEPSKDDVIFGDEKSVLAAVNRLLVSCYPENVSSVNIAPETGSEDETCTQQKHVSDVQVQSPQLYSPPTMHRDDPTHEFVNPSSAASSGIQQPRWRSSMYGIDEEDLDFLANTSLATIEEEQACRDVAISNPWTIARLNAPIKPKKTVKAVSNGQLPSPAKSQSDMSTALRSSSPASTPLRPVTIESMAAQTIAQAGSPETGVINNIQRDIGDQHRSISLSVESLDQESHFNTDRATTPPAAKRQSSDFSILRPRAQSHDESPLSRMTPGRDASSLRPHRTDPFVSSFPQSSNTWFGQPMRDALQHARPKRRPRGKVSHSFSTRESNSGSRSLVVPAPERLIEARPASEINTNIRTLFGQERRAPSDLASSFRTQDQQSQHIVDQIQQHADQDDLVPIGSKIRRLQSADSSPHSIGTSREMDAFFRLHEAQPPNPPSPFHPKPFPLEIMPRIQPTSRPPRRHTASGDILQTRSSTLPLEFVPHNYETHDLTFIAKTSTLCLAQQAHKLDMIANSLGWGCNNTDAVGVFTSALTERRIMYWVVKVDEMLRGVFGRVDGVEVCGALHEGIQRFIDMRREGEETNVARAIMTMDVRDMVTDDDKAVIDAESKSKLPNCAEFNNAQLMKEVIGESSATTKVESPIASAATRCHDRDDEFDWEQFVDLDGGAGRQESPVRNVKAEDDFGDDIDEEMLMDM